MRTLYIDASVVPPGLDACRVVEVSPLLREVIAALDDRTISATRERLLGTLALDEITRSQPLPLSVPMPNEKRLRALCEAVIADPAHADSLEHWARERGASTRTIARLFRRELGVSFSQWRQQAVLARAIPLLSQGRPLAHVAQRTRLSEPERLFRDVPACVRRESAGVFRARRLVYGERDEMPTAQTPC